MQRCTLCQNLNTEAGTLWVQQTGGNWWFAACSARWARAESTIHPRVRQHYSGEGDKTLGGLVAERLAILAEVVDSNMAGVPERVQRRRLY